MKRVFSMEEGDALGREREKIAARVSAAFKARCARGVRLYILDGVVVDLGGRAELLSSRLVEIETPEGHLFLEAPEESLVQRVLEHFKITCTWRQFVAAVYDRRGTQRHLLGQRRS